MLSNNKFKAVGISAALATTLGLGLAPAAALAKPADDDLATVVRMYNKWTGEHLFSTNALEVADLEARGWQNEGTYWKAPAAPFKDDKDVEHHGDNAKYMPVYRLYNPYTSDHLYTTDLVEYTNLMAAGWNGEDVKFMSAAFPKADNKALVDYAEDDAEGIYRQFNPNVTVGTHNYGGLAENNQVLAAGWKADGVDEDGHQQPALYGYELKKEQGESYLLNSIGKLQEAYKAELKEFNSIKDAILADVKADKYKKDAYVKKLKKLYSDIKYYQEQLVEVNLYVQNYTDKTNSKIKEYIKLTGNPEFADHYTKLQQDSKDAAAKVKQLKDTITGLKQKIKTVEDKIAAQNLEVEKQNLEIKVQDLVLNNEKASLDEKKAAAKKKADAEKAVNEAKDAIDKLKEELKEDKKVLETRKSEVVIAKKAHDKAKKAFRDFRYDQSLPLGQLFRDLVFIQDNNAQLDALNVAFDNLGACVDTYNEDVTKAVETYWNDVEAIKKNIDENVSADQKAQYYVALAKLKDALVEQIDALSKDPQLDAEEALGI